MTSDTYGPDLNLQSFNDHGIFTLVLSALSKIFERCILNQLSFYLTYKDILVPKQYGFRSCMTTVDCLVDLKDEITKALDEKNYAISIFLDLSKAFDTVNHSIPFYPVIKT